MKSYNQNTKFIIGTNMLCSTKTHFYEKVLLPNENGCMEWIGSKGKYGHGKMHIKGEQILAHRYSYVLHNGKIPKSKCVLHSCDNGFCVAPNHLYIGTKKQNNKDRSLRGRTYKADGELSTCAKLSNKQVLEIRKQLALGILQKIIAKNYNVHYSTINKIFLNVNWRTIK